MGEISVCTSMWLMELPLSNHQSAPVHSHFALMPAARRGLREKINRKTKVKEINQEMYGTDRSHLVSSLFLLDILYFSSAKKC